MERGCPLKDGHGLDKQTGRRLAGIPRGGKKPAIQSPSILYRPAPSLHKKVTLANTSGLLLDFMPSCLTLLYMVGQLSSQDVMWRWVVWSLCP